MKPTVFLSMVIMAGCGITCGVFSPRDITTQPVVQTETVDPFGLTSLLEGTGATFSRFAWQEFFHLNFRYTNVNLASTVYSKDDMINHLQQRLQFLPSLLVLWGEPQSVSQDAERITLTNVVFTISDSSSSDSILYSGSSDFEIVRDAASSVWRIIGWKDLSTNSFFSPAE